MKLGILGLNGCGKSTLFDLLTESFEGPDFSQAPNKPRIKTVKVEDSRLRRLERDFEPPKYTPASFELYDFPAVSRAGGPRGGLADLLAPARALDALFVVLRGFDAPGQPPADIERDVEEVLGEFVLADLVIVERRLERLEAKSRKPRFSDDDRKEQELLGHVHGHLEAGRRLSSLEFSGDAKKRLGGFGFFSAKPVVIVVNLGEDQAVAVDSPVESGGSAVVSLHVLNELEIARLPVEEQAAFLEEFAIERLSRADLIAAAYRAAGVISFFTACDKEVRAWSIRQGQTAVEAAESIHSDMARGFIRAETVSYADYVACGGIKGARERGQLRLEGKGYVVADGDVVEFRFSV